MTKKLFLLIFSFIFAFTCIFSLFSYNNGVVVKAEEVQSNNYSNYISSDLMGYIDGAIEEGVAETFDYYSFDEKYYDEFVILYDVNFVQVNGFYINHLISYYENGTGSYYNNNGGLQFASQYNATYSTNRTTVYVNNDMSTSEGELYTPMNCTYTRYPSYITDYNQMNDGYFLGSMFYFQSGFEPLYEVYPEKKWYSVIRCSNGTDNLQYNLYEVLGQDSSYIFTPELVFSYIDFNFITLSSLVNYAYSKGYNDFTKYGLFTDCTIDVEFEFSDYYSDSTYYYNLNDLSPQFKDGFLVFNFLSDYDEIGLNNDVIIPNESYLTSDNINLSGNDLRWSGGRIEINLPEYILYDNPYFLFLGEGAIPSVVMYGFNPLNNDEVVLESERYQGYLSVPNYTPYCFINKIALSAGRGYDSVQQFEFKDYSSFDSVAYNNGYDTGFDIGFAQGRQEGYNVGSSVGYNNGYSDAIDSGNVFTQLFSSVLDVPVNAIVSIFDINILGVNMKSMFLGLLGVVIVLSIIRFFIGR